MALTEEDVREILRLIEESEFRYFRLRSDELNLTVSKGGYVPVGLDRQAGERPAPAARPQEEPAVPEDQEAPESPGEAEGVAAGAEPAQLPEAAPHREGLLPVTAPMVGTFYRAPEPGADPFVEVGSRVEAETTVGLIEVMKVFTSIPAGMGGTVAEVVAANAQFVERSEVLFFLTPDGGT